VCLLWLGDFFCGVGKEKMLSEENEDGDEQRNRERYDLSQLHQYPTITYT
jgi:hypothetical protein